MVLEAIREILGCGPDLYEVGEVARAAQRYRRLVEEEVDVDRPVLLAVAALLVLLDDSHDWGEAFGERRFVREVGASEGDKNERC